MIIRILGTAVRSICYCNSDQEEENKKPAPWDTAVQVAETEIEDVCQYDKSQSGWEERLLNCIIAEFSSLVNELENEERDRLANFKYIYIVVEDTGLDRPLARRSVQNPYYYKALYERTRAELEACRNIPTQTAQADVKLLEKVEGLKDELLECKTEKSKLEVKCELLEKSYEECKRTRDECLSILREIRSIATESRSRSAVSDKLEKILDVLAENSPQILQEGIKVFEKHIEKQAEVEKIRASAEVAEKMAKLKEKQMKDMHQSMVAMTAMGTLHSLARKFGLIEEEIQPVPQAPVQSLPPEEVSPQPEEVKEVKRGL
jgi:hypothetical protein